MNKFLWKYKWRLFLGTIFIVLSNTFNVYAPQVINEAIDLLKNSLDGVSILDAEQDKSLVLRIVEKIVPYFSGSFEENKVGFSLSMALALALIYFFIFIIKGVFLFLTRQTIIIMSRLIEFDMKDEVFAQYLKLDIGFYKRNNTGDLMNRISEDVGKVRMYLGPAIMYTINLIVLFVLIISVMLSINVELTIYVLTPLPIMSVIIYYVSSIINKKSDKVQRQQSKLSTIAQETFSGIRVLKAYNREDYATENFEEECGVYKDKTLSLVKTNALFMPSIILLIGLSTIITIYVGGLKVISGEITLGDVAQFIMFVNIRTWPFASLGWVTSLVQRAAASQARINEFLESEPEIQSKVNSVASKIDGNVEFNNVNFIYPDSGIQALENISFKINAGETLAIVGRTGSGKSTIAQLIARFYDTSTGDVLIDNNNIKNLELSSLRDNIGYVPQDVFLFSDTIKNNIGFGTEKVNQKEVEEASKNAGVYENIKGFKEEFETMLGERGITLSGGQKQRISIARAIIKNPSILIFDDCLSAVDTETEEFILNNLKRIMKNKTTIIISHRISTIQHANRILVLDDGKVIESGTHDSLIKQNGAYADIYQKQLLEDKHS